MKYTCPNFQRKLVDQLAILIEEYVYYENVIARRKPIKVMMVFYDAEKFDAYQRRLQSNASVLYGKPRMAATAFT